MSASAARSFGVRRIPENAPHIISADEAWSVRPTPAPWSQTALALDFDPLDEHDEFGRRPTRSSLLPEPHPFVAKLAQAVIEVVSAQRPVAQLIRHLDPAVYSVVARRALVATRRQAAGPRRAAVVRRVRICEPADGVVEGCAVVVAPGRVQAVALRLEGLDGRWVVTALTIG